MKTYVITAEVNGDNSYLPYRMPDWFNPYEMCHVFRLVDDDGEVLYYGLSNDPSSFDAQDDYEAYCGCTATQYFNQIQNEWDTL
jgi:hypothetical protein